MKKFFLLLIIILLLPGCSGTPKKPANTKPSESQTFPKLDNPTAVLIATKSLNSYLQISKYFYSINPDDMTDKLKPSFLSKYRNLFSGKALKEYEDFFKEGSFESGYFAAFYKEEKNLQLAKVLISEANEKQIKGLFEVTNNTELDFTEDHPIFETFIRDHKVSNYTQTEFDTIIQNYDILSIDVAAKLKCDFTLIKENNKWKFSEFEWEPTDTILKTIYGQDLKTNKDVSIKVE